MDVGDGLKALADVLPVVALFVGAGYALGHAYREHWREKYNLVKERGVIANSLLQKGNYDLKNPKDVYFLSKTIDAVLSSSQEDREQALADLPDVEKTNNH